MTVDADSSTVWTGHADGVIKVHRIYAGLSADAADLDTSLAVQYCQQGRPVSSLAVEAQSQPRCWAGDIDGRVFVFKLTATDTSHMHLLHNTTGARQQACTVVLRLVKSVSLSHKAMHVLLCVCHMCCVNDAVV